MAASPPFLLAAAIFARSGSLLTILHTLSIPLDTFSLTNLKSIIIGLNLFGGSGVGDGPELYQAVYWGQKKIQMTNF